MHKPISSFRSLAFNVQINNNNKVLKLLIVEHELPVK